GGIEVDVERAVLHPGQRIDPDVLQRHVVDVVGRHVAARTEPVDEGSGTFEPLPAAAEVESRDALIADRERVLTSLRRAAWRAAFLLLARQISTQGNCDTPAPPDGTTKARQNPFAVGDECVSRFDLGSSRQRFERPGSLIDGFCSRCHMPTNYIDNVPLQNVRVDALSGVEHGALDVNFNPTSHNGTGLAFATLDSQMRNTDSGKSGVVCMVCHSMAETRNTPYHNFG